MGCRSSKNINPLPPIDSNFPTTQRPELDSFFQKATGILERIEILRNQIHTTKQKGAALAGTSNLGSDYSYFRAVEVLFWSISAAKQGNINGANIIITEQFPPFIAMNTQDYCKETLELFQTLQQYFSILLETPESLSSIVQQLQKLKDEQIEIKRNINVKGNPAKAAKTIDDNMKKLTDGINTSAKVLSQVPDEQQNALELTRKIQKIISTADEMGSRAFNAKLVKPLEIFKWTLVEKKKEEKTRSTSPEKSQPIVQGNNYSQPPDSNHQVNQNMNQQPAGGVVLSPNTINVSSNTHEEVKDGGEKYNALNRDNNNSNIHSYQSNQATVQQESNQPKTEHKMTFDPSQNGHDSVAQFNQSSNIYGTLQKENNHVEKSPNSAVKKQSFFAEAVENIAIEDSVKPHLLTKVKAPGYLSPGGSKQAGILQGEENIKDEEIVRVLAYDSTMARSLVGKTQPYLGNKN